MILTAGRMSFAFRRKQYPAMSITALGRLQRGADNSGLDFSLKNLLSPVNREMRLQTFFKEAILIQIIIVSLQRQQLAF